MEEEEGDTLHVRALSRVPGYPAWRSAGTWHLA